MTPWIVDRKLQSMKDDSMDFEPDGCLWGGAGEGAKLKVPSQNMHVDNLGGIVKISLENRHQYAK